MEFVYSNEQNNTDSNVANRNIHGFIFFDTILFRAYHSTPSNFSYISLTNEQADKLTERFGELERYTDEQLLRNKYLRFPESDASENLAYITSRMEQSIGEEDEELEP